MGPEIMDEERIMLRLIMRFSYSLLVLVVYAGGAVVVELLARGMRAIGVGDLVYYMFSGAAHLMLFIDLVLLLFLLLNSAKRYLKGDANEP